METTANNTYSQKVISEYRAKYPDAFIILISRDWYSLIVENLIQAEIVTSRIVKYGYEILPFEEESVPYMITALCRAGKRIIILDENLINP